MLRLLNAAGVVVVFTPDGRVALDISDCSSIVAVAVWGIETKELTVTGTAVGMLAWTVEVATVFASRMSTFMSSSVLKSSSSQMQTLKEYML